MKLWQQKKKKIFFKNLSVRQITHKHPGVECLSLLFLSLLTELLRDQMDQVTP